MPVSTGATWQADPTPLRQAGHYLGPWGDTVALAAGPQRVRIHAGGQSRPCACPSHCPDTQSACPLKGGRVGFWGCAQLHKGRGDHFVSPNSPRGHSRTGHRKRQTTKNSYRGLAAKCHTLRGVRACGQSGKGLSLDAGRKGQAEMGRALVFR